MTATLTTGHRRGGLLAAGGVGALAYTAAFDPATEAWFPTCVLRACTGLWCPGCGMTRAVHHLTNGDIVAAVRLNLLVVPLAVAAMAVTIGWWRARRRGRPVEFRLRLPWALALATTVAVFTVARNLPELMLLRGG